MEGIFNNWETAEIDNRLRYYRNQRDVRDHVETNKNAAKRGILSGKQMNQYNKEYGVN